MLNVVCVQFTYTLAWTRVGGPLPYNAEDDGEGTLTIRNIRLEDAGEYSCTGSNFYSIATDHAVLKVGGKVKWGHVYDYRKRGLVHLFGVRVRVFQTPKFILMMLLKLFMKNEQLTGESWPFYVLVSHFIMLMFPVFILIKWPAHLIRLLSNHFVRLRCISASFLGCVIHPSSVYVLLVFQTQLFS